MSPLGLSLLLLAILCSGASAQQAAFYKYLWPGNPECQPVAGYFAVKVYCPLEGRVINSFESCHCDNKTNELVLRVAENVVVNETGHVQSNDWRETARYFLGGCTAHSNSYAIYALDTPGVCGPTFEEVKSFGRAFDAQSYAQYLTTNGNNPPRSSGNSRMPLLLSLLPLVFM